MSKVLCFATFFLQPYADRITLHRVEFLLSSIYFLICLYNTRKIHSDFQGPLRSFFFLKVSFKLAQATDVLRNLTLSLKSKRQAAKGKQNLLLTGLKAEKVSLRCPRTYSILSSICFPDKKSESRVKGGIG